jgi:hypothetical protein
MIALLITFWSICWFIVATFAIIHLFDEEGCSDIEEISFHSFFGILMGLIWPLTIWVALVKWYNDGRTPAWAEALVKFYNFIKRKGS